MKVKFENLLSSILRPTIFITHFFIVIVSSMIQLQIVEMRGHPFFIGAQFHPEFKSRPGKPSPLFSGIFLSYSVSLFFLLVHVFVIPSPFSSVKCNASIFYLFHTSIHVSYILSFLL